MKIRRLLMSFLGLMTISTSWAQVQFSQPHGLYEVDELTVTIIPSEEGLDIRYTTDGSLPTMQSPLYKEPLKLKETALLRACEVWDESTLSPVTTASYIFMESVMNQSNNPEGYPTEWGKFTDIQGKDHTRGC